MRRAKFSTIFSWFIASVMLLALGVAVSATKAAAQELSVTNANDQDAADLAGDAQADAEFAKSPRVSLNVFPHALNFGLASEQELMVFIINAKNGPVNVNVNPTIQNIGKRDRGFSVQNYIGFRRTNGHSKQSRNRICPIYAASQG